MPSYTSNDQYGSIKEWYWWVSANTARWIHGRLHKRPYDTASIRSVLALPDPGWFWVLLGEKRVQARQATYQLASMDPKKNDPDELQQIQSVESMGDSTNCLMKLPAYVLCWHCQIKADYGSFWVKKGSKHAQLHIKCPVWIHNRMILMSFNKYSPWDPWETPQTALYYF